MIFKNLSGRMLLRVGALAVVGVSAGLTLHAANVAKSGRLPNASKFVRLPNVPQEGGKSRLLPNGWRVSPAGRQIALPGDMPQTMLISPDGKSLIVNTAGYHTHSVNVIDLASESVKQSVDVGKDWCGMCMDAEGDDVFLSGGGKPDDGFLREAAKRSATPTQIAAMGDPVMCLAFRGGVLTPKPGLAVSGLNEGGRWISGLAFGNGDALYVANLGADMVYRVAGKPRAITHSAHVGRRPYALSLSGDKQTLAVSNWADGAVTLLGPATLKQHGLVKVGSHPNAVLWSKDGRLFVACSGDNSVGVIQNGKVVETIKTSIDPYAPIGSTPDALALSPDGKRLYVANADNNDVAVIDISDAKESRVLGFIPTGWYPSALAISHDGKRLFIGVGKGLQFRANATSATKVVSPESVDHYDYIGDCLTGAVSVVSIPDAKQLAAYTKQVVANTPHENNSADPIAIRSAKAGFAKIKHVVYIIRENRTYDEVFGDIPKGNGRPDLCLFGRAVTPNAHALAGQYTLLDNLYCNGEVSEDGHRWCDAAYATDYTERMWTNGYSGRGEPDDDDDLSNSPAGSLWDNCARHGVSYRAYGEAASFKSSPNTPPVFTGAKALDGHSSFAYSQIPWFDGPRDLGRADIFIRDLHEAELNGNWPRLMILGLPEDHTEGLNAGAYTPTAHVGENDLALGKIVDAVSHSKFWDSTAIFVIEDDAQNGPDHVDAHRTVGLVVSPYVRPGVDSTLYSTASYVHTMEIILGLPPMTQFDAHAAPLYNSFSGRPILTAFNARKAEVDLVARNPKSGEGAAASAKLDFSAPDRADPNALNAILWRALRPGVPQPAPVRSASLVR
jgi:YVTN family beta-propeller protein